MRSTILFTAICIVGLSQAGLATPHELLIVKLSKPDTSQAVFVEDRNACLTSANNAQSPFPAGTSTWARRHLRKFGECMGAKGYKNDPNGLRAIRYSEDDQGSVFIEAL